MKEARDYVLHPIFHGLSLAVFFLAVLIGKLPAYAQQTKPAIAYTSLTDGHWQIWIKEFTGEPYQLTSTSYDKRTPAWSPDGKKIVFRSNNQELFLFDFDTKKETQILKYLGWITDPSFVGHNKIIFSRFDKNLKDESDLWISDLDGKEPSVVTKGVGLEYSPQVSPDGKKILFMSGKGYGTHEIYLFDLEEKSEIRLTQNRALEIHPVFSPDGKSIAYASDESGNFDIFVMDLNTRQTKQLTNWLGADLSPTWSPDGAGIAFASDRSGILQVWIMSVDGTNPVPLIHEKIPSQEPSWR